MDNKVTFGLEQVHIAFEGVAQTETIGVLTGATTDGEITVAVTAAAIVGSPISVIVPMASETYTTATKVASAIVNTLNGTAAISVAYRASNIGAVITLTAKVVAVNDATLSIAVTPGTTGVTVGASTNGVAGATGWGVPQAIPGAVGFKPKAEGKDATFYADNSVYFTSTANNGYTGDLETALIPDSILAEMLGWAIDANGGLVEDADGIPKRFALMYQVQGDARNRRIVYYECQAARPAKENKTKGDAIEPATDVIALTVFTPVINGKKTPRYVLERSDANAAVYDAFFNAVTFPAA